MLPPVLRSKWGHLRFIKKRGNEWSAECPRCGDGNHIGPGHPDRFVMWDRPRARGWCRQCGFFEFAEDMPVETVAMKLERNRLERKFDKRHDEEIERNRERMKDYWRGYHDAMNDMAREMWREAGIPDSQQDWWQLGYNPEYKGKDFVSPALTIPFFHRKKFITMQSRLLKPPKPNDKYRFLRGLPATVFLPDKDSMPSGSTVLVEGAKKAMVVWLHMGHKVDTVIGLPNKNVNQRAIDFLKDCDPVYIMLDPDAEQNAIDGAAEIGLDRARIVTVPVKPDDFIVKYRATGEDLWGFVNHARRVSA